ncbi:hypothetical protein GUITHDRAFT_67286 [Guillardia theta CCMP2712]|uniref:Non-specific protein-tyrosine kinase n=1 Tax=Guillardia theta (strain CCMP2712) TaxID=905079 RepID=L1JQK6_GUITC|nr:hypothetical protein GUITHDRAFT_67286 [Guillardia theta CCMP2712]EKX50363.1 hypothetical protein GUITHDRAFT_67286 [Guillardia theta CCMP2712]|eukprot:XP_005837343.1 hypothetical protein GUITHDRAFT_67286 [Guillardia theta CCMP2712]
MDVAMLEFRGKEHDDMETFRNEVEIMRLIGNHPHLAKFYCPTQLRNGHYALVMEYAPEGSLDNLLQKAQQSSKAVSDEVLLQVGKQVCDGMMQLSVYNVVHGDLACRNILVFSFDYYDRKLIRVKISDFGLSLRLTAAAPASLSRESRYGELTGGPLRWMAPEVMTRREFSEKSDIWSYGVTLWELWTNCSVVPYASVTEDEELRRKIILGHLLEKPECCNPRFYEIMQACWRPDPSERPSFTQVKEQVEDAFLMLHSKAPADTNKGGECQICLSDQVDYAILPCGHKCLCSECRSVVGTQCPLCRRDIREIVRIFD